jgi:hypothetical protein
MRANKDRAEQLGCRMGEELVVKIARRGAAEAELAENA